MSSSLQVRPHSARRSCRLVPLLVLGALALTGGVARAETYKIDPVHSMIYFKIGHLGAGNVIGRFNDPTGVVVIDPSDPSKNRVEAEVKVASIDTHNDQRDGHLKSEAFFDAAKYPLISFKSTAFKAMPGDRTSYEVTGDLTLHGVTKSVTINLVNLGTGQDPMMKVTRVGFETSLNIKRSDFGMTNMLNLVGDQVTLMINLETIKQ